VIPRPEGFLMPKEQSPAWKYLTFLPHRRAPEPNLARNHSYLFFWARNALYYSLEALGITPGSHVLLPSYLCTAAVEAFTVFGAEVEFYEIGRDCEPDFGDLESKVRPATKAVLAVHYFGFPQNIRAFRDLCDRHQIALIEDCAHVLRTDSEGQMLGSFGDASVFSWRKFLPLYDGAELRLNRPAKALHIHWKREHLSFTLKVAKCLLDRLLENFNGRLAGMLSQGLEFSKTIWRKATGTRIDQPLLAVDSNQASFDPCLLNCRISRVSKWLFNHSDISAVVQRRRDNFLFLQQELRLARGVRPLHRELPADVCPWVYPVFFDDFPEAHLFLRNKGIPAVTWGGVRPHTSSLQPFPDADFLYDNLVFLPVHQNLTRDALKQIVQAAAEIGNREALKRPSVYAGF
jgi:dTDP-4-amino-4,6-dideoxygalactose transaminase